MLLSEVQRNLAALRKGIRTGAHRALEAYAEPLDPATLERLAGRFLACSPEQRRLLLDHQPQAGHPQVLQGLLDRAAALRARDPAEYLAAARTAQDLVQALRPTGPLRALAADLRASAWAEVANAHRVGGDLRAASRAWRRAEANLERGSGDALLAASLIDLKASLRRAQRRFGDAAELLNQAAKLFEAAGESHHAGRSWFKLATVYYNACDLRRAYACMARACDLIDPHRDPSLTAQVVYNLSLYLAELGAPITALECLLYCAPLFQNASPIFRLRASWFKGRLFASRSWWDEASVCFDRVRRAFMELRMSYDAALASLDLAVAYGHQGRWDEVRRLAEEMYPVFTAQDIHREAVAALLLFVEAARRGELTVDAVAKLAARLRHPWRPSRRMAAPGGDLPDFP